MMTSPLEAPPRRGTQPRPARGPRDRRREAMLFSRYCATRDPSLREQLVKTYLPLARTIARRYQSPRVPTEDLVQVAAIGLMKAVDRYEPTRGSAFTSYAVPTMVGEVQRYFRDQTWSVRPPRDLQERALRLRKAGAGIGAELGRAPTPSELARATDMTVEQVVEALEAAEARDGASLDRPRSQGEEGDTVADTIGHEESGYDRVDAAITAAAGAADAPAKRAPRRRTTRTAVDAAVDAASAAGAPSKPVARRRAAKKPPEALPTDEAA